MRLLSISITSLGLIAFLRDNLPRIEDGVNVINLDDKLNKGIHCVPLFIDRHMVVYFDFFRIEYIPQEILNKVKDKSITHNIFRIQGNVYYV